MADRAVRPRRAGTSADRIVFLGHASVLIELDGVRLLTDPLLRGRVAHLRRRVAPVDPGSFADVDAVLISHLHHDHLDLPSLRALGTTTPVLAPRGAGEWLRARGFDAVRELSPGASVGVGALSAQAVEARHHGWRTAGPRADSIGWVARGRRSVYFAGDTELFDAMEDLAGGLDVALLPVAGWGSTLGPGHMDPLDAARAAAMIRPRVVIPIHWGTLSPIGSRLQHGARREQPVRQFAEHVAQLAPDVEVRVLQPGQEMVL